MTAHLNVIWTSVRRTKAWILLSTAIQNVRGKLVPPDGSLISANVQPIHLLRRRNEVTLWTFRVLALNLGNVL